MPEPASRVQSHVYGRKCWREQWRSRHFGKGQPTASILRYTQVGGNAAHGVAPTATLVANLANLRCISNVLGEYDVRSRGPTPVQLREGDRDFEFLDETLYANDVIEFEGRHWTVLESTICVDTLMGWSGATCRLVDR